MSDVPSRWWFVGSSGSGKTTYARCVASVIGVPHHELDATFHQPEWTPLARDEFQRRVEEFVRGDAWCLDGNYRAVRPLVLARTQVIVAFDLPKRVSMRQVTARTLRRWALREVLWNGNREPLTNFYRWHPHRNIIRWAWTHYDQVRERIAWFERLATHRGIECVRVRSHAEARAALARLTGAPAERFVG
jgi:adenylate kinase family enzyme